MEPNRGFALQAEQLRDQTARTDVARVLDALDPILLGLKPATLLVSLVAANRATPLFADTAFVYDALLIGGPHADGVTDNVGTIFLGGPDVTIGNGLPIRPGVAVPIGRLDLSQWYIVGANAADVIRILFRS